MAPETIDWVLPPALPPYAVDPDLEDQRVRSLRALDLLDTPPDPALDALAVAAARTLDCRGAAVTLMDEHRQWFKARHGLDAIEWPRAQTICNAVLAGGEALFVDDLAADARWAARRRDDAPPSQQAWRAYAGVPLQVGGRAVGTLCAFDFEPRRASAAQRDSFAALARACEAALEREARSRALHWRLDRLVARIDGAFLDLEQKPDGEMGLVEPSSALQALFALEPEAPREAAAAFFARVHASDLGPLVLSMYRAAQQRQSWSFEVRVLHPERGVRWVAGAAQARVLGPHHVMWHGHVSDVTERRSAVETMARTQRRLQHALRVGGLSVVEIDLASQSVTSDAAAAALHGRGEVQQEQAFDDWLLCVAVPDRERVRSAVQIATAGPARVRYALSGAAPAPLVELMLERGDAAHRVTGLVRDVTDEEQRARALREQAAAELSSRRQSEFLSRVSHELRTPLHAVLGFVELMRGDPDPPLAERHREWSGQALKAGQHLLALINDLLDMTSVDAGLQALAPRVLDAAEAIDEVHAMLAPLAAQQRVTLEPPHGTLGVWADARALEQALLNVVGNAVKYHRPGGRVRTFIRAGEQGRAEIAICDDGPGIPEALRARLFQPFERLGRTQRHGEGSGLGLSITRRLVEAMGGSIDASFPPEGGTCVTIALQRADARGDSMVHAHAADEGSDDHDTVPDRLPAPLVIEHPSPRKRALYAEDNPVNTMLLHAMFDLRDDWTLTTVNNGALLLAALRAQPADLVLLDMHLGSESGLDVMRAVRADPAGTGATCIALSADGHPEQIVKALDAGFDDYWTKPIDLAALNRRLDTLGRR